MKFYNNIQSCVINNSITSDYIILHLNEEWGKGIHSLHIYSQ